MDSGWAMALVIVAAVVVGVVGAAVVVVRRLEARPIPPQPEGDLPPATDANMELIRELLRAAYLPEDIGVLPHRSGQAAIMRASDMQAAGDGMGDDTTGLVPNPLDPYSPLTQIRMWDPTDGMIPPRTRPDIVGGPAGEGLVPGE